MAWLLPALLFVTATLHVTVEAKAGVCPYSEPADSLSDSCSSDTSCADKKKCCPYNNQNKCVPPVVVNYQTTLYVVDLPQVNNEKAHLTSYMEQTFASKGTIGQLQAERLGTCMRVSLSLQTESTDEVQTTITSLETSPITIRQFTGGPFYVTSGRNDTLCPDAIPNFYFKFYIVNVSGVVDNTRVEDELRAQIANVGKGWQISLKTIEECVYVMMEAVLTSSEESSVSSALVTLEQSGISLGDQDTSFTLTSSKDEAATCYHSYTQTDCEAGQRKCSYMNKCIPEEAFCDGKNDCGNMADEQNCNCEAKGLRACANRQFCLMERAFCDGTHNCADRSDEADCYFEVYTMDLVTSLAWQPSMANQDNPGYKGLASATQSFLNDALLFMANYSYARVLQMSEGDEGRAVIRATATFKGHMVAPSMLQKQQDILATGIVSGLLNVPLVEVSPARPGACDNKDCGTGLCVEVTEGAVCRCLPGQEPHACQPTDCRGTEDYCGANITKACKYTAHRSAHTCQCPPGLSGEHCHIDVCSQLGSGLCGLNGRCSGDLYNHTLCSCDDNFWGTFCEHRGPSAQRTMCQRQSELHGLFLQHLNDTDQSIADLRNGQTMVQRLQALGYENLQVPTCDKNQDGRYHHICVYNLTDINIHFCYCTNANGTYNGLDYVDGLCKAPSAFDPEEKAGICPPTTGGSTAFDCRQDSECQGQQKCCRVGAGRRCMTPFTVKGGECPPPDSGMTAWLCDSDGDCSQAEKCCPEGKGQLCRPPLYVTRFQVQVTLDVQWKQRYANVYSTQLVELKNQLSKLLEDLTGFQTLTLLLSMSGSVKVVVEVVASPELTGSEVQDKIATLRNKQVLFDGAQRSITEAQLVTHDFCGAVGCATGLCINSTLGARCLCPTAVYGDKCQFSDPCDGGVCQNGGTCQSESSQTDTGVKYTYTCTCPPGYLGSTCEVSVCQQFPQGLCKAGSCVGDFRAGVLCSCPLDKRGIFCQDNGTEIPFSECERRHRLNEHLADVLRGKTNMAVGTDASGLQTIFQTLKVDWLPLVTCQRDGDYVLTAEMLSVEDRTTTRHVCLDDSGNQQESCQSKVCQALSSEGNGHLCQNNGTCVGNIHLQLCNCSGTGHHGTLCDEAGEDDWTDCEHKHHLAQLGLDALSGSVQINGLSAEVVQTLVTSLLQDIHLDVLWQPDCTRGGSYAFRGCQFQTSSPGSKECYCVDDQHQRIDSIPSSSSGLPDCPQAGACSEFTSDPCGQHGQCVADLNAGALCQCDPEYSGITCNVNTASAASDCQRRSELSNYLLSMLHGFQQPFPELSGSLQDFFSAAAISLLEVPTCNDAGLYQYICTYFTDPVALDECRCTNDDGTYSSGTSEGVCQNIAKPGECPAVGMNSGNTAQVCKKDLDCPDTSKCCPAGSGKRCTDPVYVSTFRVNVTIDAPWRSEYSNLASSGVNNMKTQIEDVVRILPGFVSVTVVAASEGSVKLTVEITASAEVRAADINNCLLRLRALQVTMAGNTHSVASAVFHTQGVCEGADCGTGMCVDTSHGSRCVCLSGTSGDRCQHLMQACNCSEGQQCVRGSHAGTLACTCHPQHDASCRQPLWFCDGKADCTSTQKCVHTMDCSSTPCQLQSSCISQEEQHPCDPQPCQHGGLCVEQGDQDFSCQCPQGFGGPRCEVNLAVCQMVPTSVCAEGCVGDVHVGVLCKCPHGRAGVSCDQPAHSQCERQRAFFADLEQIRQNQLTVPLVSKTQLNTMMTRLLHYMDLHHLQHVSCSADGSFNPVQCRRQLSTQEESCHCVNKAGVPVSSNVEAYPGFPPCTAPYSPEVTGEMLCNTTLRSACRNGGSCVGNLLNGTMCSCPASHSGIFCQHRAGSAPSDPPQSLCQFSREVWRLMSEVVSSNDRTLLKQLQVLQGHLFHVSTNMPHAMIKASCRQDGTFQQLQCTYNLRTDQPVHCYCITARGVVLSSRTTWPQTPHCEGASDCPNPACSLTCEHGLTSDLHNCPLCQCRHPCDGQCKDDADRRCVVEIQESCGRDNWEGQCTSGVCRHRKKAGMCPTNVAANMTSLQTLKTSDISTCDVHCLDDADCPDNLKCCGVCGTICVKPVAEFTCLTHRSSAVVELKYLHQVKQALDKGQIPLNMASRIVRAKLETFRHQNSLWVPDCDSNGFYRLTQCYTEVGGEPGKNNAGCFCVDRHGNKISGTDTARKSDTNCAAKPGTCPFLQPNISAVHGCESDYDCQADLKCCPNGLGSQCIPGIKAKPGDAVSLDEVMNQMCSILQAPCGMNGACVRRWFTEGRVCSCNQGYHGVFCQNEGQDEGGMTPCRRRLAMKNYLMSHEDLLTKLQQHARKGADNPVITLTYPDCLADGQFSVTQCSKDVDSKQTVTCFCVDRKGKPLVGTDVPPDQTPACARPNPCLLGAPLHHTGNRSAVRCGGEVGQCVRGFQCRAGHYGELYCCRDRVVDVDVCLLPPNPGNDCQYFEDSRQKVTQQRFYYDVATKTCKAVTYEGCADDKPNFDSKADCDTRCIRKEHLGRCPTSTVVAERATCVDTCGRDGDCLEEQKCCHTSCGRRCVLALNKAGAVCQIGQPLVDADSRQAVVCSSDGQCGDGYQCHNQHCCLVRTDEICRQPRLMGACSGYHLRYFYNSDTQQCESFVYTGCGANDNNFLTKADCCNACGQRGRCKDGVCPAPSPVLSVSCGHSCYGDGDCPTNQICCNTSCGGSSCVIAKAPREAVKSCRDQLIDYQLQMTKTKNCFLRHRPRCDADGNWQRQQCQDKLGVCWCVTSKGNVVSGTRVRGVAQCQWVTPVMMEEADELAARGENNDKEECQVCEGGEEVHCCNEDLCLQVCGAHPTAECRINPCGGCRAVFYNADNNIVNCTEGLTSCQINYQLASQARHQQSIVAMATQNRQRNRPPQLMTLDGSKNQVTYVPDGIPQQCQLKPESGSCQAHAVQWFYNVTSERCEAFLYGLCDGNDNRFHTPDLCYSYCKPSASPCAKKKCGNKESCQLTYRSDCSSGTCDMTAQCAVSLAAHQVIGVHVPQCSTEGQYQYRQCQGQLCWCVTANGAFSNALTSKPSSLGCNNKGPTKGGFARLSCPTGGQTPRVSCLDKCRAAVCPGHPSARCVADLCTCRVHFVDSAGRTVDCREDNCQTNVFARAKHNCPTAKACGGKGPERCEYEEPCVRTVCPNNPCAVCVSDPCTGQLSFVDRLTGQQHSQAACTKLSHSSCQLRQCEVMTHNARAGDEDVRLVVPQCEEDGSYKSQQRRADDSLYCVDAFGQPLPDSEHECEMDPVVGLLITVSYQGNYEDIVPSRQLALEQAFRGALEDIGLLKAMITRVRLTAGSGTIDIETYIVNDPQSPVDLAVVKPLVQSQARQGGLTLRVDGVEMRVVEEGGVEIVPTTLSQVQTEEVHEGGLGAGGIAAIIIVLLLLAGLAAGAAFYVLVYRRRVTQHSDTPDSTYRREGGGAGNIFSIFSVLWPPKPAAAPDDFVEEPMEDHYVKVRP